MGRDKDQPDCDPSELAAYEQPVPSAPVRPLTWSVEKYEVAQLLALSRMTLEEVSRETQVPSGTIQAWKRHPEFQEYMNKLVLESAESMRAKRLMLLNKMLDARIDLAEQNDCYGALSSKDTLEIMAELRKETADQGGEEKSRYMQIVEALLDKTKAKEVEQDKSPSGLLNQGAQ